MSMFSCPQGAITFSRLGWGSTLAWGCVLGSVATLCELFPVAAAAATLGVGVIALVVLVFRLAARERRIRARMSMIDRDDVDDHPAVVASPPHPAFDAEAA